jgi:hypothetical protein
MDLHNLEENHTYLIREIFSTPLKSITVLCITNEAYKICWNNDNNTYADWQLKKSIYDTYSLIEDITVIVNDKIVDNKIDDDWLTKAHKWVESHAESIEKSKLINSLFKKDAHPYFLIQETCPTCNGCGTAKSLNAGQTTSIGMVTCPTCNGSKTVSKRIDILFE